MFRTLYITIKSFSQISQKQLRLCTMLSITNIINDDQKKKKKKKSMVLTESPFIKLTNSVEQSSRVERGAYVILQRRETYIKSA